MLRRANAVAHNRTVQRTPYSWSASIVEQDRFAGCRTMLHANQEMAVPV